MRSIPDDNLANPVLIKFASGASGSGFFIKTTKSLFLVTAKHVIFKEDGNIRGNEITITGYSIDLQEDSRYELTINLDLFEIVKHDHADVLVIKIGYYDDSSSPSSTVKYLHPIPTKKNKSVNIASIGYETVKLIDDVLASNDVYIFGFPNSLGIKNIPQINYNKPLLRKGIIANVYKERGTIILDCPVYPGNSGGPAVEISMEGYKEGLAFHYRTIGVVTQFVPYIDQQGKDKEFHHHNSGYSVVVCMDKVFELINE